MKLIDNHLAAIFMVLATSCTPFGRASDFTAQEIETIEAADSIMRVLTTDDPADCLVLRAPSHDLSEDALLSSDYEELARLMVATVTHPSQDGVGIAGPQVGLNRRVVAVQRFDKEPVLHAGRLDHPFEVYPNIRIVWASDSLAVGPEGCLSVPDRRGDVLRSTEIVIEYADMVYTTRPDDDPHATQNTDKQIFTLNRLLHAPLRSQGEETIKACMNEGVPTIRDTVSGFTAVIFQHEIDHLEGVLYIDRL